MLTDHRSILSIPIQPHNFKDRTVITTRMPRKFPRSLFFSEISYTLLKIRWQMYMNYVDLSQLNKLPTPSPNLSLVVTIPCYKEDNVCRSVQSILSCEIHDIRRVEVIVLINSSEYDDEKTIAQNEKSYADLIELSRTSEMGILPINISNIPSKIAGVGTARKIAMDLASIRLDETGQKIQIIAAFDADSICSKNYLHEVLCFFENNPKRGAASIHFEHDLSELPDDIKQAIVLYELHLRYFINMQRICNLPFAFQTVGSSMAVRNNEYKKLGGMNKRKAGEDFYFLQKFIKNNLCGDLQTCTIFPSSRVSDRVPFGTGRAVSEMLDSQEQYTTYSYQSFETISKLDEQVEDFITSRNIAELTQKLSKISPEFFAFLEKENGIEKIWSIISNVKNANKFRNRFYQYFDAFQLMKYVHFTRDNYYPNISISEAINYLFSKLNLDFSGDLEKDLLTLRNYDKTITYN